MLSNSPTKQPSSVPVTTSSRSTLPVVTHSFSEFLRNSGSSQRRPHSQPETLSLHYSLSSSPTSSYHHIDVPLAPVLRSPSISVKAKDFGQHLVQQFAELYTRTDLTDVSIVCGRNHDILRAHQFVLSCSSLYFRDALKVSYIKTELVVTFIAFPLFFWIHNFVCHFSDRPM